MNKNRFKVIFNKKRGQMVAVEECAAREGKSAADTCMVDAPLESVSLSCAAQGQALPMRLVSFCLKLALGSAAIATATGTFAQGIQADKNAPGNQQPTIMQSANGTPQVNIQTPSGAGVSMNQYQQMDVGEKGAILNNSRKDTPTHIGGWVQGNPWLAGGEAKIIVNQVNSGNPSALNGYIEVAGQKAEVIIANPAGLNINGAGFINAAGVQLSTGRVVMEGGQFNGLEVRGGEIKVEGQGLDTSTADYTRLLSQAATINAGIWAQDLSVVAGNANIDAQGQYSASEAPPTQSAENAPEAKPRLAIDTANLGGMYAGKIKLVSTEKGVGVNNAGQIFAGAGGIHIDANGQLTNSGTVVAADAQQPASGAAQVRIQAQELTNSGTVSSQGKSEIVTQNLSNTGLVASSDELVVRNLGSMSNSGVLNAARLDIQSQTLNNQASGKIEQTGQQKLKVSAEQLTNTAKASIGAPAATAGETEPGTGSETPGQGGHAPNQPAPSTATGAGSVAQTADNGGAVAPRQLADGAIVVTGNLRNDNAQINASGGIDLQVNAALNNQDAQIHAENLDVQGGGFTNQAGHVQAQNLRVNTATISNRSGRIEAQNAQLSARAIDNEQGKLQADKLVLQAQEGLRNAQGQILGNTTEIEAGQVDNAQGKLTGQTLRVNAAQTVDNQGGTILANQADIAANQIDNRQGRMESALLNVQAHTNVDNRGGDMVANKADVTAQAVNNAGGRISAQALSVAASQAFNNQSGEVQAGQAVIAAQSIDNQHGSMAAQALTLTAQERLNNQHGKIVGDTLAVRSGSLDNRSGSLQANESLVATVGTELNNQQGVISSGQDLRVDDAGLHTLAIDNTAQGKILAGRHAQLQAKSLQHTGSLESGGDMSVALADDLSVTQAISAGGSLSIATQGNVHNSSTLSAAQALRVNAANITNTATGALQANGQTDLAAQQNISNRGVINSNGHTRVVAGEVIENLGTGRIYGGHVSVGATHLINDQERVDGQTKAGAIVARERLDIGAQHIENKENALLSSAGDLAIGGALNQEGMATGTAASLLNASARIEAQGNGRIAVQQLQNLNTHFKVQEQQQGPSKHLVQYAAPGQSVRWTHGEGGYVNVRDKGIDFRFEDFNHTYGHGSAVGTRRWVFDRTTYRDVIVDSAPGQIIIGGDLLISGTDWLNHDSQIVVGGLLSGNENDLVNNKATKGKERVVDAGTTNTYEYTRGGFMGLGSKKVRVKSKRGYYAETPGSFDFVDGPFKFDTINQSKEQNAGRVVQASVNAGPVNAGAVDAGQAAQASQAAQAAQLQSNWLRLASSSLYHINPNSGSYLVETDPAYTNRQQWLGSDYMITQLGRDPQIMGKRLGDGYYEQRLINEQITALTGYRRLESYSNDEDQFKALMNAGVTAAQAFSLTPGVALTAEQVAQLTSDMVWLVAQNITLADGSVQSVLVPKVYVIPRAGDLASTGSLISANAIDLQLQGNLQNQGTIAGRQLVDIRAHSIHNDQGTIAGQQVGLSAADAIVFEGGTAKAQNLLSLQAQQIEVSSTTASYGDKTNGNTTLDRVAGLYVTDADKGVLSVIAQDDVRLNGAVISNRAKEGQTQLVSESGSIRLGTVGVESHESYGQRSDKNHWISHSSNEVGTQIQTQGDVALVAKEQIQLRQASVVSEQGAIALQAGKGIEVAEGRSTEDFSQSVTSKSKGVLSSTKTLNQYSHTSDQAVGSTLSGGTVNVQAGQDIRVRGSDIVSDQATVLQAGQNITVEAAQNHYQSNEFHQTTKSGLMGSGGIGFTIGSKQESTDETNRSLTHSGSTVGSLEGNTTIVAGQEYRQSASAVGAAKGDVGIAAQQITVEAAQDTHASDFVYKFQQKGLTVSINVPVIDAVQNAANVKPTIERVGQSKDNRVNAMAAANAAMSSYGAFQGLAGVVGDPSAALSGEGVSVTLTYGEQKNQRETQTRSTQAQASTVNAAGQVTMVATGAGENSNIRIIGSDIEGQQGTHLVADNQIHIGAFEQTHTERSRNSSQGFNAGIAASYGSGGLAFGVTAGGNRGKGHGDGDEVSYRTSHVGSAQSQTSLTSGGATNVIGGQVHGRGVAIQAAELNIESLQDTSRYESAQKDISGQVTVGYGASASASYSQSKIKADYAAVAEQSGVFAGDEGYQVNVAGNTDLKGALITSSQAAEDAGRNSFTTATLSHSDIENHANYKGSSLGIGLGASVGGGTSAQQLGGKNLKAEGTNETVKDLRTGNDTTEARVQGSKTIGFGRDSESDSSTTFSGINTANVNITDAAGQLAKTGRSAQETLAAVRTQATTDNYADQSGYLANNFDKDRVQKELDLQRSVTQDFDKNRQTLKSELYSRVQAQRDQATELRRENGGFDTAESRQLDAKANSLYETVRWIDTGLGAVWGYGDSTALLGMFATTQADRVQMSQNAPKEMWYQRCDAAGQCQARQIHALADLTAQERALIQNDKGVLTISNPGIFNDKDAALANAAKQNTTEANAKGVLVVMNPATGNYEGKMILTSLVSELMYAGYDKTNDLLGGRLLPLSNSQRLNQELFMEAKREGWMVDVSNHSRGGLTGSTALSDLNNAHGIDQVPIRKFRAYGTATNMQMLANRLQNNGFTYVQDGQVYQSAAYSAVHKADFVGRLVFVGMNQWTEGVCFFCYSHSSYFAEIPQATLRNEKGQFVNKNGEVVSPVNAVKNEKYREYTEKWGVPVDGINRSAPVLILPKKATGGRHEPNPY